MKSAFASVLLGSALVLSACASTADTASFSPPSRLSLGEIRAELAAISAEEAALHEGRSYLPAPVSMAPMVIYVSDSNGVPLTAPIPDLTRSRPAPAYSRPFGYVRLDALSRRRAQLYAELGQRGASPQ